VINVSRLKIKENEIGFKRPVLLGVCLVFDVE